MSKENEIISGTGKQAETGTLSVSFTDEKLFPEEIKNPYQRIIADYLEANASKPLRENIREAHSNNFSIQTCYDYIVSEARKLAKDNCAMVADDVVFGWAVHYYEDEWQHTLKVRAEAEAKMAAEKAKREAEKKAKAEAEAKRIAAMTPEERELEERAKAEEEARKQMAAEEAEREKKEAAAKRRAEQKALKKLENDSYEAAKAGQPLAASPDWSDAQQAAYKAGIKKANTERAAAKLAERQAKAEAKAKYEAIQGDLFAGLLD